MSQKILILDDDAKFCQTLARQFIMKDYLVFTAANILEAKEIITEQKPNHAIFDLRLQEGSSLTFIQDAKNIFPQINILILTGYASINSVVKAIKLGASNYLAKPASFIDILAKIEEKDEQTELGNNNNLKINEMEIIMNTLSENDYNISQTAQKLNMHRRTLQRKLQKKQLI